MQKPRKTKTRPGKSIPNSQRHRKARSLTLSDEAVSRADALAEARGTSRSGLIEALILEAPLPTPARVRRKRSEIRKPVST